MIVVDACAWFEALVVRGARADATRELLIANPRWAAPAHMPLEVVRTIQRSARAGILERGDADRFAGVVATAPVELVAPGTAVITRAWSLRDRVSVYDAAYLAVAEAFGAPFVTIDLRLARAARATGIDVIVPA